MTPTSSRIPAPVERPLRIAHLADTHLGYSMYGKADPGSGRNQRAVDIERSFAAAIDDILTRDVDLVLHAGDVFHHTRPSWTTLAHFVRQMRRLEERAIPAVVIAGNHDTPRLRTTGSVYRLLELTLPLVKFITGYEVEEQLYPELGVLVHGVPHGAHTNPDPPALLLDRALRNIVVSHGTAQGFEKMAGHEPGEIKLRGNVLDSEFAYVALGHIHQRNQVSINAWYSGSTERTSWGDQEAEPGYAVVTLGEPGSVPQVEFRDIAARPMLTLNPIDGAERTAEDLAAMILERAGALDMPEAMMRVQLDHAPRPLFRETDALVRRQMGSVAWHIRLTAPGELLDPLGRDGASGLADLHPLTLFADFVRQREAAGAYEPAFASAFRERGLQALEEAIQRAQVQSAVEGAS